MQVNKLSLKKVKKLKILKTFLQLCFKYASEQLQVKIWCYNCQKLFKTLITSRFQGMYCCAHKTATLTSIQHTVGRAATSLWQLLCTTKSRTTDFLVRKSPSLHGRKSTPTPKFLGTAKAYFVCHISPNFQISLIYAFIGCP
jgi:hypothetical protein